MKNNLKKMIHAVNVEDMQKFKDVFDAELTKRIQEKIKTELFSDEEQLEEGLFDTIGKAYGAVSSTVNKIKSIPGNIKASIVQKFKSGVDAYTFSSILKKYNLKNTATFINTAYPSYVQWRKSKYTSYVDFINDKYPSVAKAYPTFRQASKNEMSQLLKMNKTGLSPDGKFKLSPEELVVLNQIAQLLGIQR